MQTRLLFSLLCFVFIPFLTTAADWATLEKHFAQPPIANNSRPLWFWNEVPTKEETQTQIKACAASGYAGLGILPAFPQNEMKFMSPEFLEQYKVAADTAKECGLKLCLYDEYWFPSGSAGGLLKEQHSEHLCKRLDMVQAIPDADGNVSLTLPEGVLMGCVAMNMKTFTRQNITASVKNGVLQWRQPSGDSDPYTVMGFVCILDGERNLVDYLEPASVRIFVELTYAAYQRAMPEHFGTTIDSAFYDEPMLYTPGAGRAWTPKFNEYFEKRFGYDPIPLYPAMFMDIGPDTASARNALFGFRATLFSEGFVKTITDWLKPYNIPLTGHVDQEEVVNPTGVSGDAIKFFEYQPILGLDQIFQYGRGSCMYKLISSAAANYDRHLVMSETYGATANMPIANLYKEVFDQAAKGVNMFVPHAVWYDSQGRQTMPPDLSPRDKQYGPALPAYNNYVGRVQTLLQQPGTTVADIAILYPIESLQSTYHFGGPHAAYTGGVSAVEDNYMRIGEYLSLVLRRDFFYLHPETLQQRCTVIPKSQENPQALLRLNNKVNPVEFRTLILPSMEVIGLETLRKIHAFQQGGGNVVALGYLPKGAAEKGKDAEVLDLLGKIFGEQALGISRSDFGKQSLQSFRVEASSQWAEGGYSPEQAFDGKLETRWNSLDGDEGGQWLKVLFPEPVEIATVVLCEPYDRVAQFQIQTFDAKKNDWVTQAAGAQINQRQEVTFPAVKTKELRILFAHPNQRSVSISEVEIFDGAGWNLLRRDLMQGMGLMGLSHEVMPMCTGITPSSGGRVVVIHENPILPLHRSHRLLRSALGDLGLGDVQFFNEESLPAGSPTGAFMYLHRIIHGRDVYFFTNSTEETVETTVILRDPQQRQFAMWNPHDGSRVDVKESHSNGLTAIPLKLGPVESRFLIGTGDGR